MSRYVKSSTLPEIQHGTRRGYNQHKHRGIPSCPECLAAWKADQSDTTRVVTPEQKAWVDGNGKVAANDLSTSDPKKLTVAAHAGYVARLAAGYAHDQNNPTQVFAELCAQLGVIDEPEQAALAAQAGKAIGPGGAIKVKLELKKEASKQKQHRGPSDNWDGNG